MRRLLRFFCFAEGTTEQSVGQRHAADTVAPRSTDGRAERDVRPAATASGGMQGHRSIGSQDCSVAKSSANQGLFSSLGLQHQGGIPVLVGLRGCRSFADIAMPVAVLTYPTLLDGGGGNDASFDPMAIRISNSRASALSGRASAFSAHGELGGARVSPPPPLYTGSSAAAAAAAAAVAAAAVGGGVRESPPLDARSSAAAAAAVAAAAAGSVAVGGGGSTGADAAIDTMLAGQPNTDAQSPQRLQPMFINDAAKMFLRVGSLKEYQSLLHRQMLDNPTLATLMDTSVRNLLLGKAAHMLHHFLLGGEEHHLVRVEVNPCAYRATEDAPASPCLVLQYKMGYTMQELNQRLRRDYILLSHIPSIVTVFDLSHQVVHQNVASINYMGNLELDEGHGGGGARRSSPGAEGGGGLLDTARSPPWGPAAATPLRQLLRYEPAKLEEMMDAVLQGQEWVSIVAVPMAGAVVSTAADGGAGDVRPTEEGHEERHVIVQEMQQSMSMDLSRLLAGALQDTRQQQQPQQPHIKQLLAFSGGAVAPWRTAVSSAGSESVCDGSSHSRSRAAAAAAGGGGDDAIVSIPEGSPHHSPTAAAAAAALWRIAAGGKPPAAAAAVGRGDGGGGSLQASGSMPGSGLARGSQDLGSGVLHEPTVLTRGLSFSSGQLKSPMRDKRLSCTSDDVASKTSKSERLVTLASAKLSQTSPSKMAPTSPLKRALMLDNGQGSPPDFSTSSFRTRAVRGSATMSPASARRLGAASSHSLVTPTAATSTSSPDGSTHNAPSLRCRVSGGSGGGGGGSELMSFSNLRPNNLSHEALSDEEINAMASGGTIDGQRDGQQDRRERGSDPSTVAAAGGGFRSSDGGGGGPVWHELRAKLFQDPVEGRDLILIVQTDVTSKVEAEARTADLLQAEQSILENIFPRHVIQQLTDMNRKTSRASSTGEPAAYLTPFAAVAARTAAAATATAVSGSRDWSLLDSRESMQLSAGDAQEGLMRASSAKTSAALGLEHLSTSHDQVTIMFADIVGFTSMCQQVAPAVVMRFLNTLYSALDELVPIYNVYKVETAGDCYIVAGGLMHKDSDGYTSVRVELDPLNALTVFQFAKALLRAAAKVQNPVTRAPIQMRIGLHSGPVVSGVVGTKMPRFCLFGDTMNTAQRMESTSRAGAIHVSEATQLMLPKERWESTHVVEVKGKGFMKTAFWIPPDDSKRRPAAAHASGEDRNKRRSSVCPAVDQQGLSRSAAAAGGVGVAGDADHWSTLLSLDRPVSQSFTVSHVAAGSRGQAFHKSRSSANR